MLGCPAPQCEHVEHYVIVTPFTLVYIPFNFIFYQQTILYTYMVK